MNKKCQNCSHRGITLLHMEIFSKGALSNNEKAYRRIMGLCKNCGEIIIEEEVKCPICIKANVKICLAKRISLYGKFEGTDYLLRCKNCGYIWRAYFKNVPKQNSVKDLNVLIKEDKFKEV